MFNSPFGCSQCVAVAPSVKSDLPIHPKANLQTNLPLRKLWQLPLLSVLVYRNISQHCFGYFYRHRLRWVTFGVRLAMGVEIGTHRHDAQDRLLVRRVYSSGS
ncbi:hypothetical protein ACCAA_400002 [Candidatus Accumulibacter aalborgensis]|uniref:Uncharacterized protein n=1 Tax=Candidatus Accumulibacter aalborgensis TaxID=1860102 RepID=A0A1A8XT46_9PROT|nr:hypothetical protein ACCAA_400002 [Candidatus Accumulibacter aalborgensis]